MSLSGTCGGATWRDQGSLNVIKLSNRLDFFLTNKSFSIYLCKINDEIRDLIRSLLFKF